MSRQIDKRVPRARTVVTLLALLAMAGCYVVPKSRHADVAALGIRSGMFAGLRYMVAASEIPGSRPTGPVRSVARCGTTTAAGAEVIVELLSYSEDSPHWCSDDRLAGVFSTVLARIELYTGFEPPVRGLTLRVLPDDMRYRRKRYSIGLHALHLDVALSRGSAVQMRAMLAQSEARSPPSDDDLLLGIFVRLIAHELFHIAVALPAYPPPADFQAHYREELAAHMIEPCVELAVSGSTLGGQYHGEHRGFRIEGYSGDRDPHPAGAAGLSRARQVFTASVVAAVRAERLLDDITKGQRVNDGSRAATMIFNACRDAVADAIISDVPLSEDRAQ